jgi:hypothetical protein
MDFKIDSKILGVVCDNAKNNSTMIKHLSAKLKHTSFPGEPSRVQCFAHTINLVVKAILSQFSHKLDNDPNGPNDMHPGLLTT